MRTTPGIRQNRRNLQREIASSLDSPAASLPLLSELFTDLTALGSRPRQVARWLAGAGIGQRSRVLDLPCGKGAVAIELALRSRCRVLGIDAFAPFIDAARDAARRRAVDDLCEFRVGDAAAFTSRGRKRSGTFDAAMMLNLWPAMRAAKALIPLTKRRGLIVIDDAVTLERAAKRTGGRTGGPASPPTAAEMHAHFDSLGLVVLRYQALSRSETIRQEQALYRRIAARARVMIGRDPSLRPLLRECLRRQQESLRNHTQSVRGAIWMLRRR